MSVSVPLAWSVNIGVSWDNEHDVCVCVCVSEKVDIINKNNNFTFLMRILNPGVKLNVLN